MKMGKICTFDSSKIELLKIWVTMLFIESIKSEKLANIWVFKKGDNSFNVSKITQHYKLLLFYDTKTIYT